MLSVISRVLPPIRHGDAAAQRLIARVGPPISRWGMFRPLTPLLPRQRGFPFLRGVGCRPSCRRRFDACRGFLLVGRPRVPLLAPRAPVGMSRYLAACDLVLGSSAGLT